MAEARLYDIVAGEWDGDSGVVAKSQEIWRARRLVMGLFMAEEKKNLAAERPELAEFFGMAALTLRDADVGSIIWGWVKSWKGLDGRRRFVAIIEPGSDYRLAGKMPVPDPATRVPTKVPPLYRSTLPPSSRPPLPTALRVRRETPPGRINRFDEAQRIADRMAHAASDTTKEA